MRRLTWPVLIFFIILLIIPPSTVTPPVFAEPLPEDTRELLEKGLSIAEIDREIERIAALRRETMERMENTLRQIERLQQAADALREKSDEVLRAYYMGRKDFLFTVLLSSRTLHDLFYAWELVEILLQSDRRALDEYAMAHQRLEEGYRSLEKDQAELEQTENALRAQRERLLALQQEVDRALAERDDKAEVRQMMDDLTAQWKSAGLPEVKRVLSALSAAMKDLPEWIFSQPGMVTTSGLKAKVAISDTALNEYLRGRNPDVFRMVTISFEENRMTVAGDNGQMRIEIGGHYTVENEPENFMRFHVDTLLFNGFALPDTTRTDLEREFDLGFRPQYVMAFIKVQSVSLAPGLLTVELRFG